MGDRCYLSLRMRQSDLGVMSECVNYCSGDWWDERVDGDDGSVELDVYEANYAMCEELEKATARGVAFYGWHAPGDGYSGGVFASNGKGRYRATEALDAEPVVKFDMDTGRPDEDGLKALQGFLLLRHEAVKIVHGKDG